MKAEYKEHLLKTWNGLNRELADLSEQDVRELLIYEKAHQNRNHMLKRLHQRFSTMRQERELEELLK